MTAGYKYADPAGASNGVHTVKLRYGGDGHAAISVLARGANASMPPLALNQDTEVLVQLVTDQSLCWEARYGSHSANSSTLFRAKSD